MSRALRVFLVLFLAVLLSGCASRRWQGSVPVESRPVPEQPAEGDTTSLAPRNETPVDDPGAARNRVLADTTWTGERVRRCLTQELLPEQEGIIEAALSQLRDARRALQADDIKKAESSARSARQLATSLRCT